MEKIETHYEVVYSRNQADVRKFQEGRIVQFSEEGARNFYERLKNPSDTLTLQKNIDSSSVRLFRVDRTRLH